MEVEVGVEQRRGTHWGHFVAPSLDLRDGDRPAASLVMPLMEHGPQNGPRSVNQLPVSAEALMKISEVFQDEHVLARQQTIPEADFIHGPILLD